MPFIQETNQGNFRINLPMDIPEETVSAEIQRALAGMPSSATLMQEVQGQEQAQPGQAAEDEMQRLMAGAMANPETMGLPQQAAGPELSGTELGASFAIPMAASAGGTMIGGAIGGPPGALVGEAIGDVGGYLINVAAGLEPFDASQLVLSATTPFIGRTAVAAGKAGVKKLVSKTKAAKFAVQEANKVEAQRIKKNFTTFQDMLNSTAPDHFNQNRNKWARDIKDATEETVKKAESAISVLDVQATAVNKAKLSKALPPVSESYVSDLYDRVSRVRDSVDITPFRKQQKEIGNQIRLIEAVNPALVPDEVRKLVRTGPEALAMEPQAGMLPFFSQKQMQKEKNTVSFQSVKQALTAIGQNQASLAVSDAPGARQQLARLGELRTSLEKSLELAENAADLAPDARKMLKAANAANFKMRTQDELSYFLAQFRDTLADQETIDFEKALRKFRSPRDKEVEVLRRNLNRLGIDGDVEGSLEQAWKIQKRARDLLKEAKDVAGQARALPEFGGPPKMPTQPSMIEFLQPTDAVQKPSAADVFRSVFGAAMLGGGIGAAGFASGQASPSQAGLIASAITLPWALSRMMMSKGGQKIMLGVLDASDSVFDQRAAGLMGSFLRTAVAQSSGSPSPASGVESSQGSPQAAQQAR